MTPLQMKVLALDAKGFNSYEIGKKLNIDPGYVRATRRRAGRSKVRPTTPQLDAVGKLLRSGQWRALSVTEQQAEAFLIELSERGFSIMSRVSA